MRGLESGKWQERVMIFVSVVLLLSLDFWTVKNVTGRILVSYLKGLFNLSGGFRFWEMAMTCYNVLCKCLISLSTSGPSRMLPDAFWWAICLVALRRSDSGNWQGRYYLRMVLFPRLELVLYTINFLMFLNFSGLKKIFWPCSLPD